MNDFFLADDLSGALDAAAAFHRAGRRVRVVLQPEAWDEAAPDEVVALTTETRNAEPARAAATVAAVLAAAHARDARLLYKKIDSTLRGPVAAELSAVETAFPGTRVLFAPANPRVGRTVRNGVLLVNGVPVAETDFARDPASPLRASVVREILGAAATSRVEIPDVATQSDLDAAVKRMDAGGGEWIGVGSGALAIAVAAHGPAPVRLSAGHAHDVPRSPILMIGGSAHPLNRRQAQNLSNAHGIATHELTFADATMAGRAAADTIRARGTATLLMPSARTSAAAALRAIVEASAVAIETAGARRIFATGGETAFALCERLGVRTLAFLEEVEPGVALACGQSQLGSVLLAVKPGGFGDEQSWIRVWQRLSEEKAETLKG